MLHLTTDHSIRRLTQTEHIFKKRIVSRDYDTLAEIAFNNKASMSRLLLLSCGRNLQISEFGSKTLAVQHTLNWQNAITSIVIQKTGNKHKYDGCWTKMYKYKGCWTK